MTRNGCLVALLLLACSSQPAPAQAPEVKVDEPSGCDGGSCPLPPRENPYPREGHSCDVCIQALQECTQSEVCLDAGDCLSAEQPLTVELIQSCQARFPAGMDMIAELAEPCGRIYIPTRRK